MTKRKAHIIVFLGDLLCLWVVWIGINELQRLDMELSNQLDMISYSNRIGFFVVGLGGPVIHFLIVLEHFSPDIIYKFKGLMNAIIIFLVVALLSTGVIICSRVETNIENAGYVYCRNASGISALAKNVVYTKSSKSCNELVKEKREKRR